MASQLPYNTTFSIEDFLNLVKTGKWVKAINETLYNIQKIYAKVQDETQRKLAEESLPLFTSASGIVGIYNLNPRYALNMTMQILDVDRDWAALFLELVSNYTSIKMMEDGKRLGLSNEDRKELQKLYRELGNNSAVGWLVLHYNYTQPGSIDDVINKVVSGQLPVDMHQPTYYGLPNMTVTADID